ncbi:MAG: tRNA (adenosine(37)-N6)-threonylcarbamoyltransferase complex dimerization subunit type 1 TsaB [Spirochaetaceae bacterium]|jgi:tRNA threonylcarbamoyladenosine biosynthesis protein TsaB|nr:tRNA (adenosine(37)-N6)-threonylcarbamoyltransferase complex dimerization subunit type 1 TsaB [Spirochaetaceae bacterium]
MNILTIDTSAEFVSVALSTGGKIYFMEKESKASHLELLFDIIEQVFLPSGIEREALNAVGVMRGPGSWTGLRIGYSAAKALCFALNANLVCVPALDCAALPCAGFEGPVISAFDAKQQRFFCAVFSAGKRQTGVLDVTAQQIAALFTDSAQLSAFSKILITGNGAALLAEKLTSLMPDKTLILDQNFRQGRAGEMLNFIGQNPELLNETDSGLLYIRASEAEQTAAQKGVRFCRNAPDICGTGLAPLKKV